MNVQAKLMKLQAILGALRSDRLQGGGRRGVETAFFNNVSTIMGEGFQRLENLGANEAVQFAHLTVNVGIFDHYAACKIAVGDGKFEELHTLIQDGYIALHARLSTSPIGGQLNGQALALANHFRANLARANNPGVAMQPANGVNVDAGRDGLVANNPAAPEPLLPAFQALDPANIPAPFPPAFQALGPENIPAPFPPAYQEFDPARAQEEYWASQLWARMGSAISFEQTQGAYRDWQKEPLLMKVLKSLYYGYQGLISLVEDIVRGTLKLGFMVLEGLAFALDKMLGLVVKDCQVLQKTVEAVGLGVDDALSQQFHLIKHPLETAKALWDGFCKLCSYLKTTYDTAGNGFLRQVFADAQAQASAAWQHVKSNPYDTIRRISCLMTHITIAVLAVKYIGPAFNKGPDPIITAETVVTVPVANGIAGVTSKTLGVSKMTVGLPKMTVSIGGAPVVPPPPVIIAPMPAAAAPVALAPVNTPVSVVSHDQQRLELIRQLKQLIPMIDLFDLASLDDEPAITALRADIIALQARLHALDASAENYYDKHLSGRLASLEEIISVLDEEDGDDKEAFLELSATRVALKREIALVRGEVSAVPASQVSSVASSAAFFRPSSPSVLPVDLAAAAVVGHSSGVSSVSKAA